MLSPTWHLKQLRRLHARPVTPLIFRGALSVALLGFAPSSQAQLVPAGFAATVMVDSAQYHGDTLVISYAAANAPRSAAPLWGFVVESRTHAVAQRRPLAGHWLMNVGEFDNRRTAQWLGLGGAKVLAGGRTPPLIVEAIGVADVVQYWLIAFTSPPSTADPDAEPIVNPMVQRSIRGATVGVVALPPGATTMSLVVRLRALVGRSCGDLNWITQHELCDSLSLTLARAEKALAAGQRTVARRELATFVRELDGPRGTGSARPLNGSAFALLHSNATYILATL